MSPAPDTRWQCPPKTILVGVDFGDASARALALAGVVASASGARLLALHAERFEPPRYFTPEQIDRLEAERHLAQAAVADHMRQFAAGASSYPAESRVVDQPPVDAILDASAAADLVIVGTHGRRGPGRWWLGSVAERVVRAATIPVLVTRASETTTREVFGRIALVHQGNDVDRAAREYAGHLAGIVGGNVIDAGPAAQCEAGTTERASLVVIATGKERPSWGITDAVAKVLGACERPVLFVPAR